MIVSVVSHKGGAGKTTTAVHLAAYFQTLAPTLLVDADQTRSVFKWAQRGTGFPYRVATDSEAGTLMPEFAHTVIDTGQRQGPEDLRAAYAICDQIVIPSEPSSLDVDGLGETINSIRTLGPDKFRVLLVKVARDAAREAAELRILLGKWNVPLMAAEIPYLKAFKKAAAAGQIVNQTRDDNADRAWDAYAAAGKELTA